MYWEFNFYLILKAGSGNLVLPGNILGSWLNDFFKVPEVPGPNSHAGKLALWSLPFLFHPTSLQETISCHLILLVKLKTPAMKRRHTRQGCLWRYRNISCLKDTIPLYFSDKMLECFIDMNSALFFRLNKIKTQIFSKILLYLNLFFFLKKYTFFLQESRYNYQFVIVSIVT